VNQGKAALVERDFDALRIWLLRVTWAAEMGHAQMVRVLSALYSLEHLVSRDGNRKPETSYLDAFNGLAKGEKVNVGCACDIYWIMGATVLRVAPESTVFGFVHPRFRDAPTVSQDEQFELRAWWTLRFKAFMVKEDVSGGDLLQLLLEPVHRDAEAASEFEVVNQTPL
jgi:hypothetical protein